MTRRLGGMRSAAGLRPGDRVYSSKLLLWGTCQANGSRDGVTVLVREDGPPWSVYNWNATDIVRVQADGHCGCGHILDRSTDAMCRHCQHDSARREAWQAVAL